MDLFDYAIVAAVIVTMALSLHAWWRMKKTEERLSNLGAQLLNLDTARVMNLEAKVTNLGLAVTDLGQVQVLNLDARVTNLETHALKPKRDIPRMGQKQTGV